MSQSAQHDLAQLLQAAADGDPGAADKLLPLVYNDLRRYAAHLLANENLLGSATLQPTLLVHEAYLRLVGQQRLEDDPDIQWDSRRHFFGAAARAMRQILIDRARHIRSARVPVARDATAGGVADPGTSALPDDPDELLALDAAMQSLATRDARQYEVVMLRYFAGLTIEETALALGVSSATVKSDWSYARAWLLRQLDKQRRKRKP